MKQTVEGLASNIWLVAVARLMSVFGPPAALGVVGLLLALQSDVQQLKSDMIGIATRVGKLETRLDETVKEEADFRRRAEVTDARQVEQIGQLQRALDRLESAFASWRKSQFGADPADNHL